MVEIRTQSAEKTEAAAAALAPALEAGDLLLLHGGLGCLLYTSPSPRD